MIGRRGLLGLLMGAPAILDEATRFGQSLPPAPLGVSGEVGESPEPDYAGDVLADHFDALSHRRDAEARHPDLLPPHISAKRSWSRSFKAHVYAQEVAEHRRNMRWYRMSHSERISYAIKLGLGGALKKAKGGGA